MGAGIWGSKRRRGEGRKREERRGEENRKEEGRAGERREEEGRLLPWELEKWLNG